MRNCKLLIHSMFFFLQATQSLQAQQSQPLSAVLTESNPINVFPANADKVFQFTDKNKISQSNFAVTIQNNKSVFVAETFAPSTSHFNVQATFKSTAQVKRGDMMLARFAIRSIYAKQESGDGVVYFFINQGIAPFERNIIVDISIGPEWKTMDIPFIAQHDMAPGEGIIGFSFGALAQKVEIANVEVLNFENNVTLDKLPITRFTYQGREENAAWRKAALQRIDEIRTASLQIKIVDANGKPVKGATVHVNLVQQEFIWGTAANEALLGNDLPNSPNYRKYLKEFFNTAVIENGYKAETWQAKPEKKEETMRAFEWLEQNGFRQRGHNAVWPGWKFNSALFKTTAETDTAKFRLMVEEDIRSKMLAIKGRVIAWDVINEPLHERHFQKYLPADIEVQWFKLAKELDPKAQLFINEYAMLNSIYSPKNIKEYLDTIASLRKAGAPIEAIGVQGHVGRQPRNPAQVITDLDLFIQTGLPVQITEFDINSPDEQLQADYTRDFLIACYSHPVIMGFNLWGFWQGAHWKPDAAMVRNDWTEKPNAAVWREWVTKKWKTNVSATSTKKGEVNIRGHLGKYEISVTHNGKLKKVNYKLTKASQPLLITIN
jgi:endo-1,4-beta-xylanase